MISKYTYKGLTWIDLESPSFEELHHIAEEYAIPESVKKEVGQISDHSKVEPYANSIYLILHFPEQNHRKDGTIGQEIDFIIGEKFMITVHYKSSHSLSLFSKSFEDGKIFEQKTDLDHIGVVVYSLIKTLYSQSHQDLEMISKVIKNTKYQIYKSNGSNAITDLLNANNVLIDFKLILGLHQDILESFEKITKQFFSDKSAFYFSAIIDEYKKTKVVLENHKEMLDNLRQTNDSFLAKKTNETIRILTIITIPVYSIMLISSIFVLSRDILSSRTEFYLVLIAMFITSIITFIYFRLKKCI